MYRALGYAEIPVIETNWNGDIDRKYTSKVEATYKDHQTSEKGVKKFRAALTEMIDREAEKTRNVVHVPRTRTVGYVCHRA